MTLRISLALACATFFAGMGIAGLARPAWVLSLFGIRLESADGRTEVRAVYGGYGVAVAGMLIWVALAGSPLAAGVLMAMAISMAGMALGRLASAIAERSMPHRMVLFVFVEVALAVALFVAWQLE